MTKEDVFAYINSRKGWSSTRSVCRALTGRDLEYDKADAYLRELWREDKIVFDFPPCRSYFIYAPISEDIEAQDMHEGWGSDIDEKELLAIINN